MNDFEKNPKTLFKGKVYAYSDAANTGLIITEDRSRYLFSKKDWLSEQFPVAELDVLFIVEMNWARSIKVEQ